MSRSRTLVTSLYENYQARDWPAAAALLHPEARLVMPATGELLLGRDRIMSLQENYPEPWGDLQVLQVVGDGDRAAAEIEVVGTEVFRCAAFWRVRDGLLHHGVEYWVTPGADEPGPR